MDDKQEIKNEEQNRFNLVKEDLTQFCDATTAHGLGHSSASKNYFGKIFWIAVFFASFSFALRETYILFTYYQGRPTQTKVSLIDEKTIEFPVVVLCNNNMIKHSKFSVVANDFEEDNETWAQMTSNEDGMSSATVLEHIRNITSDEKKDLGHLLSDMLVKCTWNAVEDCKKNLDKYWKWSWHWKYGNCYSFNSGGEHKNISNDPLIVQYPGPTKGLKIKIDIEQEEYIGNISPEAGLRVFVGARGQRATPYNEGFSLSPGNSYYIPVKKTVIERSDPWNNGSCQVTEIEGEGLLNSVDLYSITNCRYECLSLMQRKRCNCTVYWLSNFDSHICLTKDEDECIDGLESDYHKGLFPCLTCYPPCREVKYTYSLSFNCYPSQKRKSMVYENEQHIAEELYAKNNIIVARFFYSQLDVLEIKESTYYKVETFMGDFGGLLGLWTGVSVLTVIEFVIFIATCCFHLLMGRRFNQRE